MVADGKIAAPCSEWAKYSPPKDKPLFSSLYDCMRWAWYGSVDAGGTIDGASYVQLQSDDKRERDADEEPPKSRNPDIGGKPRGYDAAAQAGMIKAQVLKLPDIELCHVVAKFLIGQERVAARRTLQPLVLNIMELSADERRIAALLLARFYGKRLTINGISKHLKINRRHVTAVNESLLVEMDAIGYRAETRLYNDLQRMGVVQ